MVTKGIVEELIDDYKVRVRIPSFNGIQGTAAATDTKDLYAATIATIPNCKLNLQLKDIVYLAFEDNKLDSPVIIGQLSRATTTEQNAIMKLDTLNVGVDAYLPSYTHIGDVTPQEINCLKGINKNLQIQLEILSERIAKLEEELNKK